jgi:hypothetical protein
MRLRAPRVFYLGFLLALTGCGTSFSCGSEFGAPPERAFWCAQPGEIGKFFEVPPPPPEPTPPTVTCTETLGDRDCVPAGS